MKQQFCTMCGAEFDEFDTQNDISLLHNVGYGSAYDGEKIELHLCCECLDKLMQEYIIPKSINSPFVGLAMEQVIQ